MRDAPMADVTNELLKTHLRQLRLPTMGQEFETLARDAAATNQTFAQLLLRLTEQEWAPRAGNAVAARIKNAEFPVLKDFDTYDFSVMPGLSKPKILELSRCEWIEQKSNCCLVGGHGTGKTHIAVSLGQAACRAGLKVRFFTAAGLVSRLETEQKQYTLDRFLGQLDRTPLLICDELGYVTMSPGGVELRRSLRARQHAGDEQPALQRVEPDLPGRADDRGAVGPADPPRADFRDEWR